MRVVDYNLIKSKIDEIVKQHAVKSGVAMDYFVCETLFELDHDVAQTYITDSESLKVRGENHDDRGIDILYLNQDAGPDELEVNLVNCKFKENFESASSFTFPTTELSKIESALTDLTEDPLGRIESFNSKQKPLIEEIGERYNNSENVAFNVFFCSDGAERVDTKRLNDLRHKFRNVAFNIIGCDSLIKDYRNKTKPNICGKIVIQKNDMFNVANGFIAKVNAAELLRLFSINSEKRNCTDFELNSLVDDELNDSILRDNVRKFKGVTNLINSNIIKTAKDENESCKFFYYNNGLTTICSKIKKSELAIKQVVTLEGMQVVNGGQTLRCLDQIRKENLQNLENIYLLCRFYEIDDLEFSTNVAEFTNSQTAVTNRDIKSIDEKQRKLQELIKLQGYFYQIKAKEFEKEKRDRVIDLEKIAQCIYAFDCECPSQARNNKKDIFSTKYDEIFTDNLTDSHIIELFKLSKLVIKKRNEIIEESIAKDLYNKPEYNFVISSDFFVLYGLKKLYLKSHDKLPEDLSQLISLYDDVYKMLQNCVVNELKRKSEDAKSSGYSNSTYFKNIKLKEDLDKEIEKF